MDKRRVEQKLNRAVKHAVPDVLDSIMERCAEGEDAAVPMDLSAFGSRRKRRYTAWVQPLLAAAVLLLALNLAWLVLRHDGSAAVDTVVQIDVNPSIALMVNKQDRVVSVNALNGDAEAVLDGMDLSGARTTVAVNAVVGALLRNGYLDAEDNAILVSVNGKDSLRVQTVQDEVVMDLDQILSGHRTSVAILCQTVEKDAAVQADADAYEISEGKALLVQKIVEVCPDYTKDELSGMNISELNQLVTQQQPGTVAVVNTGNAEAQSSEIAQAQAEPAGQQAEGNTQTHILGTETPTEDGQAPAGSVSEKTAADAGDGVLEETEEDAKQVSGNKAEEESVSGNQTGEDSASGNKAGSASGNQADKEDEENITSEKTASENKLNEEKENAPVNGPENDPERDEKGHAGESGNDAQESKAEEPKSSREDTGTASQNAASSRTASVNTVSRNSASANSAGRNTDK
ncbi:MAG: hypothetical protein IJ600_04810 [Lachnospiraceae bacterium]|nr:hypothetical protein [Lachnospiraceae bacterium]